MTKAPSYAPLANVSPFSILEQYESGSEIRSIGERLGVSHVAVYKHLLRHIPDEWQSSQAARALGDYEDAKQALDELDGETCTTQSVTLACARVKRCEWELERTLRRLYGPTMQLDVSATLNVGLALKEARERARVVIEADAVSAEETESKPKRNDSLLIAPR